MQQCPDCASLRARHRHPSQKSAPEDTNPNLSIALPYNRMLFNSLVVYFFLCEVRVFVFQGKSKCYSFGYLKNHPSKHRQRPTSLSVCLSVCLSIYLFVSSFLLGIHVSISSSIHASMYCATELACVRTPEKRGIFSYQSVSMYIQHITVQYSAVLVPSRRSKDLRPPRTVCLHRALYRP